MPKTEKVTIGKAIYDIYDKLNRLTDNELNNKKRIHEENALNGDAAVEYKAIERIIDERRKHANNKEIIPTVDEIYLTLKHIDNKTLDKYRRENLEERKNEMPGTRYEKNHNEYEALKRIFEKRKMIFTDNLESKQILNDIDSIRRYTTSSSSANNLVKTKNKSPINKSYQSIKSKISEGVKRFTK